MRMSDSFKQEIIKVKLKKIRNKLGVKEKKERKFEPKINQVELIKIQ